MKGLLKVLLWEGVGDGTELQHIDPHSYGHNHISFPLSWAAQQRAWRPTLLAAGFLYHILSSTDWTSCALSYIIVQCPPSSCGRHKSHSFNPSPVKVIFWYSSTRCTCYLYWCISYFHSLARSEVNIQQLKQSFSKTCNICGAFNKFPDFFVQAFKIVVDSWKFTMLLLYILWDDSPIFMISGSNKQLQQQLEYILLKPDYHSWWISKLQSGREDALEERYAIKFCFKLGKNATETYGMLQTAFRPSCMNRASVFEWHKRFKEARESVRDDERCGTSKEVNTPELIGQRVRVTMLRS